MDKKYIIFILLILICFNADAQCAMCRAQINNQENQGIALGINKGIGVLAAMPYILVSIISYIIYRIFKKNKSDA